MNALSLITWMQEHPFMMMLIALSFFLMLFGLKALLFARLKSGQLEENKE